MIRYTLSVVALVAAVLLVFSYGFSWSQEPRPRAWCQTPEYC